MHQSSTVRVFYDITVLGLGYHTPNAQTGIFRVIEALSLALAERDDVTLTLCARAHQFHAQSYAQTFETLAALPTQFVPSHVALSRAQFAASERLHAMAGLPKLTLRVWRKLLELAGLAARIQEHPLPVSSLRDADIFHATFYPAPLQVRRASPRLHVFQTVYDLIALDQPQFFTKSVVQTIQSVADSLTPESWAFCISEATKADLCRHANVDPARVFVTPLAADPARFYPAADPAEAARVRQRYGIPDGRYFLSLCTLEPRKNIDHVIRSFVRLQQEHPDPELLLVLAGGKGWHFDRIFQEMADAAAFKSQIVVTGFVEDVDLAYLYSGALCFVYMSLYEGFGLPPLEAMQCGVPVIVSDVSSLPEVVGSSGILLPPTDVDGLCQAMLNVSSDADLRARLASQSVERAGQFSWERCAAETVKGYETACGS